MPQVSVACNPHPRHSLYRRFSDIALVTRYIFCIPSTAHEFFGVGRRDSFNGLGEKRFASILFVYFVISYVRCSSFLLDDADIFLNCRNILLKSLFTGAERSHRTIWDYRTVDSVSLWNVNAIRGARSFLTSRTVRCAFYVLSSRLERTVYLEYAQCAWQYELLKLPFHGKSIEVNPPYATLLFLCGFFRQRDFRRISPSQKNCMYAHVW